MSMIHKFYGIGISKEKQFNWRYKPLNRAPWEHQLEQDAPAWAELNKINISEFVQVTAPTYIINSCTLNEMSCKRFWKLRQTFLGRCLELNPANVIEAWNNITHIKTKLLMIS